MFSWVEPVLSNDDEVSCSRIQHRASRGLGTCDLVIKESGTLPTELMVLPMRIPDDLFSVGHTDNTVDLKSVSN